MKPNCSCSFESITHPSTRSAGARSRLSATDARSKSVMPLTSTYVFDSVFNSEHPPSSQRMRHRPKIQASPRSGSLKGVITRLAFPRRGAHRPMSLPSARTIIFVSSPQVLHRKVRFSPFSSATSGERERRRAVAPQFEQPIGAMYVGGT
jgi:hypothetical protein